MKRNNLLKRVTSLVVGLSMAMSLSIPSFAGRPDPEETGIDEWPSEQLCSIEITKTATDGKVPVDGIEFSYVKVANVVQTKEGVKELKFELTGEGKNVFSSLITSENKGILSGSVLNNYMKNTGVTTANYTNKGLTSGGKVLFNNLQSGVYLIGETDTSKATINGESVTISKGVNAFLVTAPATNAEGTAWVYDVKVKAKNIIDMESITKSVEGDDVVVTADGNGVDVPTATIGSTLWYTLSGSVSNVVDDTAYMQYEFDDAITSALAYGEKGDNGDAFSNKIQVYIGNASTGDKLNSIDYVISLKTTPAGRIAGFNLGLLQSGLDKLNAKAKNGETSVTVRYPAHIVEAIVDYDAVNKATIKYMHKGGNPGTEETTHEVYPLGLEIEKLFDNTKVENLPTGNTLDATKVKFTIETKGSPSKPIYVKPVDITKGIYVTDLTINSEVNGYKREFNTSKNGSLTIIGLPKGTYIVTEIATVDGYSLLKEAIEITIDKDQPLRSKMIPIIEDDEALNMSGYSMGIMAVGDLFADGDVDKFTQIMSNYAILNGNNKDIKGTKYVETFTGPMELIPGTVKVEKGTVTRGTGSRLIFSNGTDVTSQYQGKIKEAANSIEVDFSDANSSDQFRVSYEAKGIDTGVVSSNIGVTCKWINSAGSTIQSMVSTVIYVDIEKINADVEIMKVDSTNQSSHIPGAVLELSRKGSNTPIETFTTTGAEHIVNLKYGDYVVRELAPPPGYELDEVEKEFSVNEYNYETTQTIKLLNSPNVNIDEPNVPAREFADKSKLIINNEKAPAFELPSTGGIGTFIYTITGILLMGAACLLYVTLNNRAKSKRDK